MGLAVYIENQIHERSYAGTDAGEWLTRVVAEAERGGTLSGIYQHGDTMFNIPQLNAIEGELAEIATRSPAVRPDVDALLELFEQIRRKGGYLWISGD
ncbi:nucleoporin NDC1 [Kibdelosporangium philippinense]|uniref:Nucleoporin NDC1 n=1 Tax=Kibdelosporangium philippinense TaxID=211113 RepID=A0ABS8ZL28_9PSEU|nr:nucleoporin NDC1 [Kibdelosporangium philippinense]MCE7008184.1 nucleoporin NDC1 [Kibdelosporangium philippinense]